MPTAECEPDVLAEICELVGFENTEFETGSKTDSASWLLPRIELVRKRLAALPNDSFRAGSAAAVEDLKRRAENTGYVEIPIYRLVANKPNGS